MVCLSDTPPTDQCWCHLYLTSFISIFLHDVRLFSFVGQIQTPAHDFQHPAKGVGAPDLFNVVDAVAMVPRSSYRDGLWLAVSFWTISWGGNLVGSLRKQGLVLSFVDSELVFLLHLSDKALLRWFILIYNTSHDPNVLKYYWDIWLLNGLLLLASLHLSLGNN